MFWGRLFCMLSVFDLCWCYFTSDEKLPVEPQHVKGSQNLSTVQQHQSAERNSRGSSLRTYLHKHSTKPQDPQLKTPPVAARTQVGHSSLSAARTSHKNESVSRTSLTSHQSSVKSPVNGRASHSMETASVSSASVSGKQSNRTAVESRGASRKHNISDSRGCENKKHGSHSGRGKGNRSMSPACSERNDKMNKDSDRGRLSKSPPYTGRCQHHCRHQVCVSKLHFTCQHSLWGSTHCVSQSCRN